MNKCTDSQQGRRLYAYEAGLLSEADREQFEIHLLECQYCNQQAARFAEEARLIRDDREVHRIISDLAGTASTATPIRPRFLQIALTMAAVLAFLLLRPWQLEFRPTQEAVAADNRLAVMYFDNLIDTGDPDRLGEIIATLIITDISESHYLKVVSSQRLFDIMRELEGDEHAQSGRLAAATVASQTGAQWLLSGSIVQTDPDLALSWQVVDATSGDVLASQTTTAQPGETVFDLADQVSADVRHYLGLPLEALKEPDLPVAEVTTYSTEAYRLYLEGMEYYSRLYYQEAIASFKQAVEHDSTFAMAYYHLARLAQADYLDQALRFVDRTSRKEQLYIASLQARRAKNADRAIACLQALTRLYPDEKRAWYLLGTYAFGRYHNRDAVRYLREAIRLDRLYKLPFNSLAYVYDELGEVDSAVWALSQYIALAPDEPNPHHTKGDILAKYGRMEEANDAYQKSADIRRDFGNYASLLSLARLAIYRGEYAQAHDLYSEIVRDGRLLARSRARTGLGLLALYRGRLREAYQLLTDGIAADRQESATAGAGGDRDAKHYALAIIAREWGNDDLAVAEVRNAIEVRRERRPNDWYTYRYFLAQELALNREYAEAEQVADELKARLEDQEIGLADYWYSVGCIHFARGEISQAVGALEQARTGNDHFYTAYMLSLAYLQNHQPGKAVEQLTAQHSNYGVWRLYASFWAAKSHYYLGLAYEQLGQPELARAEYEKLVSIWSEADQSLVVLADTRNRLARLRSNP